METKYKTMEEIMNDIPDRLCYSCVAGQLAMLAITQFAEKITKNGATILRCSPRQIELDNGKIVKVLGSYIKYTYNFEALYCIQFDQYNPFFSPMGYKCNNHNEETYMVELPNIFNSVNEYSSEENNVKKLVDNMFEAEVFLKELPYRIKKSDTTKKFLQEIYYNN